MQLLTPFSSRTEFALERAQLKTRAVNFVLVLQRQGQRLGSEQMEVTYCIRRRL
jgi:hypothetical protein